MEEEERKQEVEVSLQKKPIDMKWINFVTFIIIIILLSYTLYLVTTHIKDINTGKLEGIAEREGYYNCYCSSEKGLVTFASTKSPGGFR